MDFNNFIAQLNSTINNSNKTDQVEQPNQIVQLSQNESMSQTQASAVESSPPLKLLIVSTHINQINGYSKVIYNIIQQLANNPWIELVHFATQKIANGDIGRKYPDKVKVIDATSLEKQKTLGFAFQELPHVIQLEKPNVILIYNDLAVTCAYIEEIRKNIQNRSFKIWSYIDIVYESPPQQMIDILNRDVEHIFCFNKGWKDHLKSLGITRPLDVMTHGIDPKMFRTIPRDLARQSLGLPKDIFLFTSLNKNIPRKRLDITIMAFVKLITRFPLKPIFMLIVADKGENGGFQLFDIYARELKLAGVSVESFGNRLLIASKSDTAYRDEDINMLYNVADVGISCAEGEGYGLCTFEQMSVGVPQIVPNIIAHREYCNDSNSIIVTPVMRQYLPQAYSTVTGEEHILNHEDVSKAMEKYVFDEDLRKLHGKQCKDKISTYTWDKCCATFIKRLKSIKEDIDSE